MTAITSPEVPDENKMLVCDSIGCGTASYVNDLIKNHPTLSIFYDITMYHRQLHRQIIMQIDIFLHTDLNVKQNT